MSKPTGLPRVALCFGGHIRDYAKCHQNIQDGFITVLEHNGYQVDSFASIWHTKGHRSQNWNGEISVGELVNLMQPKSLLVEQFDRQHFLTKYNTEKYKEYSHLSTDETCGDSVSMWYKVWSSFQLMEAYAAEHGVVYDIVVRIRFDMLFDSLFQIEELSNLTHNTVYIPRWHGKYHEVCHEIMDQFMFGDYTAMKRAMSIFPNIRLLMTQDIPHTGEGFLYGQLKDMDIRRTSISFSVMRAKGPEKVVE
jgi:hypothetical protein